MNFTKSFRKFVALSFLLALSVVSCASSNALLGGGEEESTDFITEGLPLHGEQDLVTDVVNVRFYGGDRYIPYISVEYFLREAVKFELERTSHAGEKHLYENRLRGKRFTLLIDAKKDTIYCPEWYGYATLSTKIDGEGSVTNRIFKVSKTFSGQKPLTFDLSKYGMKIYGGIDDAYVPLVVMSQIFSNFADYWLIYNGKDLYMRNPDGSGVDGSVYHSFFKSPWFIDENGNIISRPKELVELNYNLLCFTHDYLYGYPGYYGFADDGTGYVNQYIAHDADSLNFDTLLKKYAPVTRLLLHSSSYRDYFEGLARLIYGTYGDMHASLPGFNYLPKEAFTNEEYEALREKGMDFFEDIFSAKRKKLRASMKEVEEQRKKLGDWKIPSLLAGGKTAVIRFDHFTFAEKEWETYYSDKRDTLPDNYFGFKYPLDTLGLFHAAFHFIMENPAYTNVENVIVDLSGNMGGDMFALRMALVYLVGNGDLYTYDAHTDTKNHDYVPIADVTLDGQRDENDFAFLRAFHEKYNLAVLTSFVSFSCGNMLPNACADAGIPILGERSGGGSCFVGTGCTADGFLFKYSSNYHLCHADWTSVESGAPVTKELPYSSFYDDAALQAAMDEIKAEGRFAK